MAQTQSTLRRGWRALVPPPGTVHPVAWAEAAWLRLAGMAAGAAADPRLGAGARWCLAHAGHFLLGCLVGQFLAQAQRMAEGGATVGGLLVALLLKFAAAAALWGVAHRLCAVVGRTGACSVWTQLPVLLLGSLVWLSQTSAWFGLAALAVLLGLLAILRRAVTSPGRHRHAGSGR